MPSSTVLGITNVPERGTLAEQAYRRLEEMIVTLELPPGSFVSEMRLSERLGIGRTPIREALQRLRADHLVVVAPRRGVAISGIHVEDHLLVLAVRRALERVVVAAAVRNRTDDERRRLFQLATEMESAGAAADARRFLAADREFNAMEAHCAHNLYAAQALAPLHALSRRYWYMHQREHGGIQETARLHATLARAIASGDESAALAANDALMAFAEQVTLEALPALDSRVHRPPLADA